MKTNEILHILRNPYGYSQEETHGAHLAAADEIEKWQASSLSWSKWASENNIDMMLLDNKGRNLT